MPTVYDLRERVTRPHDFCVACGRPAPLPPDATPLQLRARARQWRAEARRLVERAMFIEELLKP